MAYTTVYSPEGVKFEVASRDRADKLILEEGWTQTPQIEEAPKKRSVKKKKAGEPVELDEPDSIKPKAWFSNAVESGEDT